METTQPTRQIQKNPELETSAFMKWFRIYSSGKTLNKALVFEIFQKQFTDEERTYITVFHCWDEKENPINEGAAWMIFCWNVAPFIWWSLLDYETKISFGGDTTNIKEEIVFNAWKAANMSDENFEEFLNTKALNRIEVNVIPNVISKLNKTKAKILFEHSEVVCLASDGNIRDYELNMDYSSGMRFVKQYGYNFNTGIKYVNDYYVSCGKVCFKISPRDAKILYNYTICNIIVILGGDEVSCRFECDEVDAIPKAPEDVK